VTQSVLNGLQVAKDLLYREITRSSAHDAGEMLDAIEWIERQEAIDKKRRGPRSAVKTKRRRK
jgi:hypothetical protein